MASIAEQLIARLQNDPSDGAAYEELKEFYRQSGDLASLANLLEGWAGNNGEQWELASDAYCEAGDAVFHGTGDLARARLLYQHALHLNVLHPHAGARVRALLEEHAGVEEQAEFLDSYARALEQAGAETAYVADLYTRLGELWQNDFQQADTARAYFNRATELRRGAHLSHPGVPPASQGRGLSPGGDALELADDLDARAAAESSPEQRAALLAQLATVRIEQLADLEGGIVALRQALTAVPGDIQVMHQLASCLLSRAEGLDPHAAAADHRRVAELFYQIAQGVEDAQAVAYVESALQANPGHEGAMDMLERLAAAQGRTELLPGYWVAYVAVAGEGVEADARRVSLAQAYLKAGQLDDAAYCLKAVAERGNERAHELLQRVYGQQAVQDASHLVEDGDDADRDGDADDRASLPTTRPPSRRMEDDLSRDTARISQLRQRVHELVTARRHEDAAELCREILTLDQNDPEAFNLLESQYRKRRDHGALRDLLLASTRTPGLSVDARKLRLREVATISETKLREPDAATSAWRSVVTLDPADREATRSLKRLLKRAQQWDEFAGVLEREALATTDVNEKAALLREIAVLHRDRRKDPAEAADAFRQLYALKPEETGVRDELAELFVKIEAWEDAAPVLLEKLEDTSEPHQQLKLASQLAEILHEKLSQHDAAHAMCERILALKPTDRAAFDRMERIDEQSSNHQRLLTTLERRALLAPKAERPALFTRMGVIAEEQLGDVDQAAEYLGDALDLAPTDAEALGRLTAMFERAGRYDDLVELLRERSVLEKDPRNRVALHRRIAQTLAEHLDDDEGAAESWKQVLAVEEDEAGLRYLHDVAVRNDDHDELASLLGRLAAIVGEQEEQRDFLYDRAVVLHEKLGRSDDAAAALKRIVEDLDPDFMPAIEELALVCEATSDLPGLAMALERQLALSHGDARLTLARRLADLTELELKQPARAINALQVWSKSDLRNPVPQRRLRPLLAAEGLWKDLVDTLDALSTWEDEFDAREEATIAAGRAAYEHLKDVDGAWNRLLPLVEDRHEDAEAALRDVARASGRHAHLAALYVRLAQETEQELLQGVYWRSAALVYEQELGQTDQAFEAALRMLATDLQNAEYLELVDRLALATAAFPRLNQVYDRLLKLADGTDAKVELLRRHAMLLDEAQPGEALDRVLRACGLAPHDEDLLARAEALAQRTRRSDEMLVVYDRRCAKSEDAADRVRLMIRAAKLSDAALRDRQRADSYIKSALSCTVEAPELATTVERAAAELDASRPEAGAEQSRRALVQAHTEVAHKAAPEVAAALMTRGAELLVELGDARGAFDVLRQGSGLLPEDDGLWRRLVDAGTALERLDAVDAHLARLIDDAMDSDTTVALLRRRGELLEGGLERARDAAAVYGKLLQLRPDDREAAGKLRTSLRLSGRYQDLLVAINKLLQRTGIPEERLELLVEIAQTWERDLRNRWEALDAWRAVLGQDPEHEEALEAIGRLEAGRTTSLDEPAVSPRDEAGDEGPDEDQQPDDVEADTGDRDEDQQDQQPDGVDTDADDRDEDQQPDGVETDTEDRDHTNPELPLAAADAAEAAADDDEVTAVGNDASRGAAAASDEIAAEPEREAELAVGAGELADAATASRDAGAADLRDGASAFDADLTTSSGPTRATPPEGPDGAGTTTDSPDGSGSSSDEGDLASLDAALDLGGAPEEFDLLDGIEEVDVELAADAPPAPPPGRFSSAPPPPPRGSRPSMPPPVPGTTRASVPPPVPGSVQPTPTDGSRPSTPPPVPGAASRPAGQVPPLPARTSRPSMPPPVPGRASQPPAGPPNTRASRPPPPPRPRNPSKPPG